MAQAKPRVDRAERVVGAPPAAVYRAMTEASALEEWLPPEDMSGRMERFDARVGGGYRMVLTYLDAEEGHGKTSGSEDVAEVEFAELVPGERVVQRIVFVSDDPAFSGTMTMTWRLTPTPEGTRVTVEATDVPSGIAPADHEEGLTSSLSQLAGHVDRDQGRVT